MRLPLLVINYRACSAGCESAELGRQGTSSVTPALHIQASVSGERRRSNRKGGTAGCCPALHGNCTGCGCSASASAGPGMLRSVHRPSAGTATAPPQATCAAANEAPGPSGALRDPTLRKVKAGSVSVALSAAMAACQKAAAARGPGSGPHSGGPTRQETTRTIDAGKGLIWAAPVNRRTRPACCGAVDRMCCFLWLAGRGTLFHIIRVKAFNTVTKRHRGAASD